MLRLLSTICFLVLAFALKLQHTIVGQFQSLTLSLLTLYSALNDARLKLFLLPLLKLDFLLQFEYFFTLLIVLLLSFVTSRYDLLEESLLFLR